MGSQPTPDAMLDPFGDGVVAALLAHQAAGADGLRGCGRFVAAREPLDLGVFVAEAVTGPRRDLGQFDFELVEVDARHGAEVTSPFRCRR